MTDESRFRVCTRDVEFRAADTTEGDGHTLEGYAAVFSQPTEISSYEGQFVETLAPGCFTKTLRDRKSPVVMLWNHGNDPAVGQVPIGIYSSLVEDERGLRVVGRLFDSAATESVREAITAGAVTMMSFRFEAIRDEWRDTAGKLVTDNEMYRLLHEPGTRGPLQRTINELRLFECGPVLAGAYSGTSVGVRSKVMQHKTIHPSMAERRLELTKW